MEIRKAELVDLPQLTILFNAYRVFYNKPADLNGASLFLRERIENKESEILIATDEPNRLVGFLQLYPLFSSTRMKKLWLLNDLYVDNNFRSKGISVLLMEAAKQLCVKTGACGLILETAKSNIIGNHLYPRVGFELDVDHNYYSWDCNE